MTKSKKQIKTLTIVNDYDPGRFIKGSVDFNRFNIHMVKCDLDISNHQLGSIWRKLQLFRHNDDLYLVKIGGVELSVDDIMDYDSIIYTCDMMIKYLNANIEFRVDKLYSSYTVDFISYLKSMKRTITLDGLISEYHK